MLLNYKTRLSKKIHLAADVYLFTFTLDEPKELVFVPGQYVILMIPQLGGEPLRRLYSIASSNRNNNEFELLIKLVPNGKGSIYLSGLLIGALVDFQGPAGMFTLRQTQRDKVFLMTGTGYAPGRSMLFSNVQLPTSNLYLFWGVPTYKEIYFFDELKEKAEKNPQFHFYICLSREQNLDMIPEADRKFFMLGHVTDGLELIFNQSKNSPNTTSSKLVSDKFQTNFDYYLCSGREIVESLKQYLEQKGAPKEQVYFEKF